MKKIIFLFAIIAFFACEGPTGPQGPQGPKGDGMNWDVYNFTVKSEHWLLDEGSGTSSASFYYYFMEDEHLSDYIADEGNIFIYLLIEENGREIQAPLPYIKQYEENGTQWTETYSYVFTGPDSKYPGAIEFRISYNDSDLQLPLPPTCNYRIVYNW